MKNRANPFFALSRWLSATVGFLAVLLPFSARADGDLCPFVDDTESPIIKGIVLCVRHQFEHQIGTLISRLSSFVDGGIMTGMISLSILFFAVSLLGRGAKWGEALGILVRLSVVMYFCKHMDTIYANFMQVPDDLIAWTGGDPDDAWKKMERFLNQLLGYGVDFTLASGILTIVSASAFSSSFGFAVFLFGIKAILDMVFLVVQVIFVYLTAFMVIAFMFAISPIIIPLALFKFTEQYVQNWIKAIVTSMLTPMLLMICLTIFLPMIPGKIDIIFTHMGVESDGSANYGPLWRNKMSQFSMLTTADPNTTRSMEDEVAPVQSAAIPSYMNPSMRLGANISMFDHAGLNFGPNTVGILKQLLIDFTTLIVLVYLIRSLVEQMPTIASSIAGGATGLGMQQTGVERMVNQKISQMQQSASGGGK